MVSGMTGLLRRPYPAIWPEWLQGDLAWGLGRFALSFEALARCLGEEARSVRRNPVDGLHHILGQADIDADGPTRLGWQGDAIVAARVLSQQCNLSRHLLTL